MNRHITRESEMLRKARIKLGYSQQQVATMAGMQIRQYQRFEYGEREVHHVNLRAGLLMCAAVELDPVMLIFGEKPETLKALRRPGKKAEKTMYRATGGVNTHKGAIYSMGILCGALGRLPREEWTSPERILEEAGKMAAGIVAAELGGLTPECARTSGERFYLQYGITGIRGEAEAGFPAVRDAGLPVPEHLFTEGKSNDEAGTAALLAILASTPDTNVIARGGIYTQRRVIAELREMLKKTALPEREALEEMDRAYTEENLSPGGSADLLALCWMLHFLRSSGTV